MYVRSLKSKTPLFHNDHCPIAKRIKKQNLVFMINRSEFINAGYTECLHCSSLAKSMRKYATQLEKLHDIYHLVYDYRDGVLYILTNLSAWKIVTEPDRFFALYHQDGYQRPRGSGVIPYRLRSYHNQQVRSQKGIYPLVKYIVKHDNYKTQQRLGEARTNKGRTIPKNPKRSKHQNRTHHSRALSCSILEMDEQIRDYLDYDAFAFQ